MTTKKTLLLDRDEWDLVLDAAGNIAVASPPYAVAQDVASAARLFKGELFFDASKGVPYFEDIFGKLPPVSLLAAEIEDAAKTVPGVVDAQLVVESFDSRTVSGQLIFTDEDSNTNGIVY